MKDVTLLDPDDVIKALSQWGELTRERKVKEVTFTIDGEPMNNSTLLRAEIVYEELADDETDE